VKEPDPNTREACPASSSAKPAPGAIESSRATDLENCNCDSNQTSRDARKNEFTPATTRQKIVLALLLLVASVGISLLWFALFNKYQALLHTEIRVHWQKTVDVALRPGPPFFWYDSMAGQLVWSGPIDPDQKKELTGLALSNHGGPDSTDPDIVTYWAAIDELAFKANKLRDSGLTFLLVLAGVSGMLGVLIRSILDFVGNACFKNTLDVYRWWPWYLMRPPLGFLLGLLSVLIIQARIFLPNTGGSMATVWWLGVAVLVGFGTDDFAGRLRLVSQTLFGKSES
jgi:hypothetical protein